QDFVQLSDDVVQKNVHVAKVDSLFDPTISAIVGVSFFLSIFFGARFIVAGEMTIGDLIAFTAYLGLLVWPMLAFGWLFNIVERGRASYDRIRTLLAEPADIDDAEHALDEKAQGDLDVNITEFKFRDDDRAA